MSYLNASYEILDKKTAAWCGPPLPFSAGQRNLLSWSRNTSGEIEANRPIQNFINAGSAGKASPRFFAPNFASGEPQDYGRSSCNQPPACESVLDLPFPYP